jgi:hypothetical protein
MGVSENFRFITIELLALKYIKTYGLDLCFFLVYRLRYRFSGIPEVD